MSWQHHSNGPSMQRPNHKIGPLTKHQRDRYIPKATNGSPSANYRSNSANYRSRSQSPAESSSASPPAARRGDKDGIHLSSWERTAAVTPRPVGHRPRRVTSLGSHVQAERAERRMFAVLRDGP